MKFHEMCITKRKFVLTTHPIERKSFTKFIAKNEKNLNWESKQRLKRKKSNKLIELNIVSEFHLNKLNISRKIALEETALSKDPDLIKVASSILKNLFFNQND